HVLECVTGLRGILSNASSVEERQSRAPQKSTVATAGYDPDAVAAVCARRLIFPQFAAVIDAPLQSRSGGQCCDLSPESHSSSAAHFFRAQSRQDKCRLRTEKSRAK